MAGVQFAIKDAIDMTITGKSSGKTTTIDYLNSCGLTLESESVYAKKKGNDAIAFSGSRSGQFTMDAEVIDDQFLCWMLGGTMDESGKISVKGDVPNESYTIEGTFKVQTTEGTQTRQIKFYNCSPQANTDLTLSATEVSSFSLVFDVLVDEDSNILDLTPKA
jgi:hypothetical protein